MIVVYQFLNIDVRIVGGEEDNPRDQEFIVSAVVLQLVARLRLVAQIDKYLPCIRS
jgi:hypothetical protein